MLSPKNSKKDFSYVFLLFDPVPVRCHKSLSSQRVVLERPWLLQTLQCENHFSFTHFNLLEILIKKTPLMDRVWLTWFDALVVVRICKDSRRERGLELMRKGYTWWLWTLLLWLVQVILAIVKGLAGDRVPLQMWKSTGCILQFYAKLG